jgi:hypothetical protein
MKANQTKSQRLTAKSEERKAKMVEELEQEYAALRDKVRDLQEYL